MLFFILFQKPEKVKYGIYADDDYDYLQHLRDRNEISKDIIDCTLIPAPKSKIQLPSTIFETRGGQLKVGMLNKAAPGGLLDKVYDPDIAAVLDGEVDDVDELEDDFIQLAEGADGDEEMSEENMFSDEKSGRKEIMERFGLIRERFSDEDSDYEIDDDDEFESDKEDQPRGRRSKITDLLTSGSISSSVMPRNEGKRHMDACFEQIMEEYDDNDDSEDESEEEKNEFDTEKCKEELDQLIGNVRCPFNQMEKPSEDIKEKTLIAASVIEEKPEIEKVTIESSRKRNRWDCESILSTYSTLYNHPTVIREPSKKKMGLTKKDLDALDVSFLILFVLIK